MDLLKRRSGIVFEILQSHPFNLPHGLAVEVVKALKFGAKNHPDTDHTALTNLEHAMKHIDVDDYDSETGYSDKAHAIARCLLAIERIGRDYSK